MDISNSSNDGPRDDAQLTLAELAQLWELARVLATHDMTPQALVTLEAICANSVHDSSITAQQIVVCAHVLLAELCVLPAPPETPRIDRKMQRRRLARAAECVATVEHAIESQPAVITLEWHWRLFRAKCLLLEASTASTDDMAKHQDVLELLCTAAQTCAADRALAAASGFQAFVVDRLRTHVAALHAVSLLPQTDSDVQPPTFRQTVERVQQSVPVGLDAPFELWLAVAACHAHVTSLDGSGDADETRRRLAAVDERLCGLESVTRASRELRVYHLVLSGLYHLRTGDATQIASVLTDIRALLDAPNAQPTGLLTVAYLESVLDGLELYTLARNDPCAALAFSTLAIQRVQMHVVAYAPTSSSGVHAMLVGALVDMLDTLCRLQLQQCRFAELGLSLAHMLQLVATHKHALAATALYRFYVARCHMLIAKARAAIYAAALGKLKATVSNVNFVIATLLPPLPPATAADSVTMQAYSDVYLHIWVDALDALLYCGSAAAEAASAYVDDEEAVALLQQQQVQQLCPHAVLLEFAAQILEMDALRQLVYSSSSVELRVRYDFALAKWLWATNELATHPPLSLCSSSNSNDLSHHAALEQRRPQQLALVYESLDQARDRIGCCELTAELLALRGPLELADGEAAAAQSGEDTLATAMRMALASKNVLLQTRLLVAIARLYDARQDVPALATTTAKFVKKLRVLQRRIVQAKAETARNRLVLRWKSGD